MTDAGAGRPARRRDLWLLTALAAAILLPGLGARDLWNPNEPIYGLAVREMAERGDWTVPTVQGVPFAEKPILYFWAARAFGAVLGVDEWSLRLPSVVAAWWVVVGTYLLVLPYGGRSRARWSGLLAVTTYAVVWGGRTAQMDILVAATTLGVILPISRVVDHGARPIRGWALAGLAAGLGFLAKGPVGWVLPGMAVVVWLAVEGRLAVLFSRGKIVGAVVAIAVAAPWLVVLWTRGETAFLVELLVRQNFSRFTEAFDHAQPWWYYLKYVWLDFAPWAFLAPLAIRLPERSASEHRIDRLAWALAITTVLFFSLSESKRSAYVYPIAPAIAILGGVVLDRLTSGRLGRLRRNLALATLVAVAVVLGVLGVAVFVEAPARIPDLAGSARVLGAVLAGGGAAAVAAVFSRRRALRTAPATLVVVVAVVWAIGGAWVLPGANVRKSARAFATRMNACAGPDADIASYRFWVWRAGYAYYARRSFEPLDDAAALEAFVAAPGRRFVLVEREFRDEVEAALGASPVISDRIGNNEGHLFAVPPSACLDSPSGAGATDGSGQIRERRGRGAG